MPSAIALSYRDATVARRNNLLMLYKNLPEEELAPVMRVRTFLDYCAALVWLLKGDWGNVRAVCEARKEFHRLCPQFAADRRQNLANTVLKTIPERWSFSLIWQAKIKGRNTYSALSRVLH